MIASLWSGLGGKVAERWATLLISPALLFWLGGLLAWVHGHGGLTGARSGWQALDREWTRAFGSPTPTAQGVFVVVALLVVAGSARLAETSTLGVVRLLEGYWPRWARPLRAAMLAARGFVIDRRTRAWRDLARRRTSLTAPERARYAALNAWRSTVPPAREDRMPTRLGDVLRASESRPRHRYGLDAVVCWPHLWLVLPDQARAELAVVRARLDEGARWWLWGLLFCVWTPFTWWAVPVGLAGMVAGSRLALAAAVVYGRLVQASFDLYRGRLYEELGRERPTDPDGERAAGRELTSFLERGPVLDHPEA
ncbi:hypothetical protein LX15_000209 [Streptoalloteichus tenebrarius]|uniref:Uncharacterized protein n=1 Tax=Streptoalloteichus tenebrarius (strain ATCC 17920 / DSM 40477 / JCM 4838 / CBS 697.72 / NBRC 16177 / NCIMB 11028 / NRRL B-12390 / A12253. 1 / ISP 5477) TaxID=1933 RepID=A0ABT1HLY1_STRSD|nr:hypothetical protein [Streptoalloteichus tenebrarius]MCP2256526.1 hypothetical protein [Streptoalloteichus tenebrarius]BFF04879.1 hypothetical protein GCM10020241_65540 [Streptoalloteichus tenebrarius]